MTRPLGATRQKPSPRNAGRGEGEGTQRHCQVFLRCSHDVIVFSIPTCTPDGVRKRQVIRLLLQPTASPRLPDDGDGKLYIFPEHT
jgi:hypothetical protein